MLFKKLYESLIMKIKTHFGKTCKPFLFAMEYNVNIL